VDDQRIGRLPTPEEDPRDTIEPSTERVQRYAEDSIDTIESSTEEVVPAMEGARYAEDLRDTIEPPTERVPRYSEDLRVEAAPGGERAPRAEDTMDIGEPDTMPDDVDDDDKDVNDYDKEPKVNSVQQEIRINNQFASILYSDYEGPMDGESVPKIRQRVVPSGEYLERMVQSISSTDAPSVLPMYCRYKETLGSHTIYVLEEPPAFRTICLELSLKGEIENLKQSGKLKEYGYENFEKENKHPYMITVAVPFTIFILMVYPPENRVVEGCLFFRTQPLTGLGDYLLKTPFPNISDGQYVCWGDKVGNSHRSEIEAVDQARSAWWTTKFNVDYLYNYNAYQNIPGVSNFLTWQYLSKQDPMFIYKVDWLKHDNTLKEQIHLMGDRNRRSGILFGYDKMFNLFNTPAKVGKSIEVEKGYFREMFYDISNGFMHGTHQINVGDSFKYKGDESAFICSFAGYDSGYVQYSLLSYKGKEFLFKLTPKSRKYITDKIIEERYLPEVVTPAGITLKAEQILCLDGPFNSKSYKRVGYIRAAIDGKQEVSIGGEFYLVESLTEKYEIVDISKPTYYDIPLKKGQNYIFDRSMSGRSRIYNTVIFDKVEVSRNGSLLFQFNDPENRSGHISIDPSIVNPRGSQIFLEEELIPMPKVFMSGRKIFSVKDRNSGRVIDSFSRNNCSYIPRNSRMVSPTMEMLLEECLKDDTFSITSGSHTETFKIGDKVVVVDSLNPINTLNVKTIEGFNTNTSESTIRFILSDKQGTTYNILYATIGSPSKINTGKIRKITNFFNGVSSGSKIVAKVSGIPVFPKKDANIIVGFLIDTGGDDPLVLCSNGCTIWFSEMMEKFDIITMKDIRWKTLQHAPLDMSKLKIQPGDIVNGTKYYKNTMGYIISRNCHNRGLKAIYLDYFTSNEFVTVDQNFMKDLVFDSIPNPRISSTVQSDIGVTQAIPNFHGLYIRTSTEMYLLNDNPRRFI